MSRIQLPSTAPQESRSRQLLNKLPSLSSLVWKLLFGNVTGRQEQKARAAGTPESGATLSLPALSLGSSASFSPKGTGW